MIHSRGDKFISYTKNYLSLQHNPHTKLYNTILRLSSVHIEVSILKATGGNMYTVLKVVFILAEGSLCFGTYTDCGLRNALNIKMILLNLNMEYFL